MYDGQRATGGEETVAEQHTHTPDTGLYSAQVSCLSVYM